MKWTRVFRFVLAVFVVPIVTLVSPSLTHSQTAPAESDAASSCPLVIHQFRPWEIRAHVENTSGKTIVGLTFYVALADATEHWKWLHYNFDDSRPLHGSVWNKPLGPGAEMTLRWNRDLLILDQSAGSRLSPLPVEISFNMCWTGPWFASAKGSW